MERLPNMTERQILLERRNYFVREMGRLYVLGHELTQCEEYKAAERGLRQTGVDMAELDKFEPPLFRDYHVSG